MMHVDPVYIVACTDEGEYVLATRSFFTEREDADSYASTISPSRNAVVIKLEGLFAQALRTLRELALRDLRRNPPHEETQTKAESPSDSSESETCCTT
jgi:hypothetical protein